MRRARRPRSQRGSSCLDKGDDDDAPDTDIRGLLRPQDMYGDENPRTDMGAYEMQVAECFDMRALDGDATLDCKVNILDLIYIRNRLNQSVATGDNWQADVNDDGKINILDLLYSRNRMNTKCDEE